MTSKDLKSKHWWKTWNGLYAEFFDHREERGQRDFKPSSEAQKRLLQICTSLINGDTDFPDQLINQFQALLTERQMNPHRTTISCQLARLKWANDECGWGITADDFERLFETAKPWPVGLNKFRTLRIRFGEGAAGVVQTFEAHLKFIQRVFGSEYGGIYPSLDHWKESLSLPAGNDTHTPCLEWIEIDGIKDLADEFLVLLWQFPKIFHHVKGVWDLGYRNIGHLEDNPRHPHYSVLNGLNQDVVIPFEAIAPSYKELEEWKKTNHQGESYFRFDGKLEFRAFCR